VAYLWYFWYIFESPVDGLTTKASSLTVQFITANSATVIGVVTPAVKRTGVNLGTFGVHSWLRVQTEDADAVILGSTACIPTRTRRQRRWQRRAWSRMEQEYR